MAEPLLPIVQLKFGTDDFIVSVPPEHLVEFTATDRQDQGDTANFVFIDPQFTKIENLILNTDRNKKPLLYRWGYPGEGLESVYWRKAVIETYLPTMSVTGTRINLGVRAQGSEFAVIIEPTVYYGKISDVVKVIAKEMGFSTSNMMVEETDDDVNTTSKTEWFSANWTRIDMIIYLARIAKSKSNPSRTYNFKLGGDGTFHFHTVDFNNEKYLKWKKSKEDSKNAQKYRRFKVLFAYPSGILSFTPQFNARSVGSFAQTVLATTYDPRTKQFNKRVLTRESIGMGSSDDPKNPKTVAGPLVKSSSPQQEQEKIANARAHQPVRQMALGGRCSGKTTHQYANEQQAGNKIENAFKTLHEQVQSATLELVGLPEYADFSADEIKCDILVVLPDYLGSDGSFPGDKTVNHGNFASSGLHWSSGRYYIKEVVHSITGSYSISAELYRAAMLDGPDDAKTGPPKKPSVVYVK